MLKNKRILAIVMTLMMVVSMLPGMAFAADASTQFSIVYSNGNAVANPAEIDMGVATSFGVKTDYSGEYHIHCSITGGAQTASVSVADDGKAFNVIGNRLGSTSCTVKLNAGANCNSSTCANELLGESALNLNIVDPTPTSVVFDIVNSKGNVVSNPETIDMGVSTAFGVRITNPTNYTGEYHIHYETPSGGGASVVSVTVASDGKTFSVKGNGQGTAARIIKLHAGANCGTEGDAKLGATTLNLNVVDPQDIDNPAQGENQTIKLRNYRIKEINKTDVLTVNKILASGSSEETIKFAEGETIKLSFVVSNQPNHLGKSNLYDYMHVYKVGETEAKGTIVWEKLAERGCFDVTISGLEADSYVFSVDKGFCTRTDRNPLVTLERDIEYQFVVAAPAVDVESITLDKDTLELTVGDEETLTATVTPENATDKAVTWTSSDKAVATVDESGKVTAVSAGEATITATTSNGKVAECKVTVEAPVIEDTRLVTSSLTEVPAALRNVFADEEELKEELISRVITVPGYTTDQTAFFDVKLQVKINGKWVVATEENFPAEGITVEFKYPEGTSRYTHDFMISHMFTVTSSKLGTVAGETEQPEVTETATGIKATFKGLSPISISWKETAKVEPDVDDNKDNTAGTDVENKDKAVKTGDEMNMALYAMIMMITLVGAIGCVFYRRQRQ